MVDWRLLFGTKGGTVSLLSITAGQEQNFILILV